MDATDRFTVYVVGLVGASSVFRDKLVAAGIREEHVHTILSTMPCQVKANQPREVAERFAELFRQAGAEVEIRAVAAPAPAPAPSRRAAPGTPPPAVAVRRSAAAGDDSAAGRARSAEAEIAARRAAKLQREARSFPPLGQRMAKVFTYVRAPSVLLVLLGLAILTYFLRWAPMIGGVLAAGLEAAIYFRMVEYTAAGEETLEPPDFTDIYDDIIAPFLRYLATLVPLFVAIFWAGLVVVQAISNPLGGASRDLIGALEGPGLLLLAWVILWPLLTAVAAMHRSATAVLNPMAWIAGLRVLGADYVLAVLAFYAVLIVEILALPFVAQLGYLPMVTPILLSFLMYLFMAARARILGALLQPHV